MKAVNQKEIVLLVVPFRAYPEKPEWKILAESFTDELISNFSRFYGLSVIAQFSARQVRSLSDMETLQKINPDYLIAGTLRSSKNNLGIHAQLIRTTDWKVVFAFEQDEEHDSLIHSRDRLVQQMVNVLRQQMDFDLLSHSGQQRETKFPAYKNWLLGMNCLKKSYSEANQRARTYFKQALEHDPFFAPAYSGMSLSYMNEWSCQLWERWEVSSNGAKTYAEKALELDPCDCISLLVMGRYHMFAANYEQAEHYLRKSLLMNPGDASNLLQLSFCFMFLGYLQEAEKFYLKACLLNPLHDETYFSYGSNIYFEKEDFEKAIELGKKVDLKRTWVDFPVYMAAAYHELGDPEKAAEYWNRYLELFSNYISSETIDLAGEALKWHLNVNPYKGETKLQNYRAFLKQTLGVKEQPQAQNGQQQKNAFVLEGDVWSLCFGGERVFVKDVKGLHDLKTLLENEGEEISCLDLIGAGYTGMGIPMLDQKAKAEIKEKLFALKDEIQEYGDMGHSLQAEKLQQEYDQILSSLGKAVGLGGKTRKSASVLEKSRSAVTWRIRSAIKKIAAEHPALGKHLKASIRTGNFCSYKPAYSLNWELFSGSNSEELTL